MKQLTWLRIVHFGEWCLRLALFTSSGACQKWMNWRHISGWYGNTIRYQQSTILAVSRLYNRQQVEIQLNDNLGQVFTLLCLNPSQTDWYSICPRKDRRHYWPRWLVTHWDVWPAHRPSPVTHPLVPLICLRHLA